MKSKKGFTLIELICALVVVSIALLFGMQLYTVGAKGYSRSAVLDADTQKIAKYFETGAKELPQGAVPTTPTGDAVITAKFGNTRIDIVKPKELETIEIQNKKTKTSLSIFKSSKGNQSQ
ncbi:MAG: prepilin-type N-terminal cleavage/methylation domain-containing protein [Ruthenibacterium sp.]